MENKTLSLAELSRMGKLDTIMGYDVVSGGSVKGKISDLIRDKYGRLSGIEIEYTDERPLKHSAIAYNKIESVDTTKKLVNANL